MKATAWEFRFRFWIILAIYALGFTTPWDAIWRIDPRGINGDAWGWLAAGLSRGGAMPISTAFNVVLVAAIVCAVAGAWLRVWGAAYLSDSVVHDEQMRADSVVAAGPYRYMRNPLYVGSWLNTLALTLLLRPSGAVFMVVGIVVFLLRLILAEEVHLRETLGQPYAEYCARVPRIFPALRPRVKADEGARAQWGRAAAAEVYMWMSAASFAVLGWQYDERLLLKCVLVSLGVSLVVKGVFRGK
ncbi:MAG: isoprenylcysteine carboxylmethyltransferase family protein [Acidobacteriaceae bacterium]|jgi:protein-S-isoprenylcysteine O-methyltransferase Ste14